MMLSGARAADSDSETSSAHSTWEDAPEGTSAAADTSAVVLTTEVDLSNQSAEVVAATATALLDESMAVDDDTDSTQQAQLRRQLLEIQADRAITDRERAQRMQALLSSRYLKSRGRRPSSNGRAPDTTLTTADLTVTYHNEAAGVMGCAHYQRNCKLQCSTCSIWSTCRFCHNELDNVDHELVRQETKNMLCMFCKTAQPAQQYCRSCSKRMASYYCAKCKLWDNDPNKSIYHCNSCGICRVGLGLGKDFFHCDRCNGKTPSHRSCATFSVTDNSTVCMAMVSASSGPSANSTSMALTGLNRLCKIITSASSDRLNATVQSAESTCSPRLRRLSSCSAGIRYISAVTTTM